MMGLIKLAKVLSLATLIVSVVYLAFVSAQLTISGQDAGKVINLQPPTNNSISAGGGAGGNVTSVSSGDAYIVIPTTTGNVVVSLNTALLNTTIDQMINTSAFRIFWYNQSGLYGYNETQIVENGNQTFTGQTNYSLRAGQSISFNGVTSGGVVDKAIQLYWNDVRSFWIGKDVFGVYDGIVLPNLAGSFFFGIGSDDLSVIKQYVLFTPTLTEFNTITGVPFDFKINQSQNFRISATQLLAFNSTQGVNTILDSGSYRTLISAQNTSILGNLSVNDRIESQWINVSVNATIPHYIENKTTAFNTNYTNGRGKVIRVTANLLSIGTNDVFNAEARIILQPYDSTAPKYVKTCKLQRDDFAGSAIVSTIDGKFCVFAVPVAYNWSIYSIVSGSGSMSLKEVEVTDE